MALKTRVWGAGKLLILLGVLLTTYLLFAAASMRVALRVREVTVPDLAGRSINEANDLLAPLSLTLRVEPQRRRDAMIPIDHIAEQDPVPGLTTRRDRSIRVWLSEGSRPAVVPALVGESELAAQLRLENDSLELSVLAEIRSADYPPGAVVAQDPPAHASGSRVAVLVNRGEPDVTFVMPDLIGVSGAGAAELLRARGFRVSVVGDHPYPGVSAGIVLRQQPPAGFQIAPGEAISIEVSR